MMRKKKIGILNVAPLELMLLMDWRVDRPFSAVSAGGWQMHCTN